MQKTCLLPGDIPAIIYGEPSERAFLAVHGKSGRKEDAALFASAACAGGYQVLAIDLPGHGERTDALDRFDPWHVVPELRGVMGSVRAQWRSVSLYAVSIGAWFSILAFADEPLRQSLFVSPVLDMKKLIEKMMVWAGVTYTELREKGRIPTGFGETLDWDYYRFAAEHPIAVWPCPTSILYAGRDDLTDRETADGFADRFGCRLTVMEDGEHWFHTPEQLAVLDSWARSELMG